MSNENKLVKKLKRREAYANRNLFRLKDKMDKRDEVMARNPGLYNTLRRAWRNIKALTGGTLQPDVKMEKQIQVNDLDRFDFDPGAGTDYGLRIRMDVPEAGAIEEFELTTIAELGNYEESSVTAPAFAGAAQGDYFIFEAPSEETYAVWLDLDDDGTEPTGAAYVAADNQLEVDIVTGDTAEQVRDKILVVLNAANIDDMNFATISTDGIAINSETLQSLTDIARHNTGDTGDGSFVVAVTQQGVVSTLQNKYFTFATNDAQYYAWFNVGGMGVDPAVAGREEIEIAISAPATDEEVADAIVAELDGLDDLDVSNVAEVITVVAAAEESLADASAGNSGFAISITEQGISQEDSLVLKQAGLQEGDIVEILEGDLKNKQYAVVEVIDANTIRLEDDSDLSAPEADVQIKVKLLGHKRSFN